MIKETFKQWMALIGETLKINANSINLVSSNKGQGRDLSSLDWGNVKN